MSNRLKLGGSIWRHYKYMLWMLSTKEFTVTHFGEWAGIKREYAWEILEVAVDAGILTKSTEPLHQAGSPFLYRIAV